MKLIPDEMLMVLVDQEVLLTFFHDDVIESNIEDVGAPVRLLFFDTFVRVFRSERPRIVSLVDDDESLIAEFECRQLALSSLHFGIGLRLKIGDTNVSLHLNLDKLDAGLKIYGTH